MDDFFEGFLKKIGPACDSRLVPPSSIDRYRGKLPNQLLAYWVEHGWSGYGNGLFWTVDPLEYEPVLEAWVGDTPYMEQDAYHIIARSAFGHLYFWGEKTGPSLTLFAPGSFCFVRTSPFAPHQINMAIKAFFFGRRRAGMDFDGMFAPAVNKLGHLAHDEIYGFVPALALGGPSTLSNLQKMKAVEHLVFLAQLAPLKVLPEL